MGFLILWPASPPDDSAPECPWRRLVTAPAYLSQPRGFLLSRLSRESPGAFAISNPGARPPLKITAAKITYQNVTEYLCSQTPECAGGRIVLAKQYRELADECLASAKTARTDKERRIFLQMAENLASRCHARGAAHANS
jgi:hypothetical protein